jgi:mitochondrial import inner membrane translocase subunit TIM8
MFFSLFFLLPLTSLQKELAAFLEKEQTQAKLHSTVHNLTTMCWDKYVLSSFGYCILTARYRCVTSTPSTRFSRGEESCLMNCVDRFLDTSIFLVKQIQERRDP